MSIARSRTARNLFRPNGDTPASWRDGPAPPRGDSRPRRQLHRRAPGIHTFGGTAQRPGLSSEFGSTVGIDARGAGDRWPREALEQTELCAQVFNWIATYRPRQDPGDRSDPHRHREGRFRSLREGSRVPRCRRRSRRRSHRERQWCFTTGRCVGGGWIDKNCYVQVANCYGETPATAKCCAAGPTTCSVSGA